MSSRARRGPPSITSSARSARRRRRSRSCLRRGTLPRAGARRPWPGPAVTRRCDAGPVRHPPGHLAAKRHRPAPKRALQQEEAARAVDPGLMPLLQSRRPGVEAGTMLHRGTCRHPVLLQHATAELPRDRVCAGRLSFWIDHVPVTEPEVELAILRRGAGRGQWRGRRRRGLGGQSSGRGEQTGERRGHDQHACPPYQPRRSRYQKFAPAGSDASPSVSPPQ